MHAQRRGEVAQSVGACARPRQRRTAADLSRASPQHVRCRVGLDEKGPAGAQQPSGTLQQPLRVAADANVAVGQEHVLPDALAGQRTEQVAAQHRRAASPALSLGDRRYVDAQGRDTAGGERSHQPTGPTSEVDRRAGAAIEQPAVLSAGGAPPPPDRQVDLDTVVAYKPD